MSNYQKITFTVANGVATVVLNDPESLNALTKQMRFELMDAINKAEQDDAVRVVMLTGEGRGFSAGANLQEGTGDHPSFIEQCEAEYKPWLQTIHDSGKIYIAAINGACAGVAGAVALNCDLIIMAEDAYIYQAFSAIGLMSDGGATKLLLERLGYQKAFQLVIEAGRLTAQECAELNIANKIVANEELRQAATAWAEKLAEGAPLAQAATKQLMRKAALMTYGDVVDEEAVLQAALIKSEDAIEAGKAFFRKEKPVFKGQ